jgi:hypothetical protein
MRHDKIGLSVYKIKNRIREELRQGPDYESALNTLMKMLEAEKDLDIYCAHEAGHITYFLKTGAKESDFVYHGPTLYFNPVPGKLCFYPCAVGQPKMTVLNDEDLRSFAKISVAGGVFEKELEGSDNLGDKDDRVKFHVEYAGLLTDGIVPSLIEQDMWEWARDEVKLELANESKMAEARQIAKSIKMKCFQANLI